MSTYAPDPHIYAEIPGGIITDGNSNLTYQTIDALLDALFWFMQSAGWECAWVNPVVAVTTTTGLFPFCAAALSQAANYNVGGMPILMYEQERNICIEEGGCCSCDPMSDEDCGDVLHNAGWSQQIFVAQPLTLDDTHTTAKAAFPSAMNNNGSFSASPILGTTIGDQSVTWPTGGSSATTWFLITDGGENPDLTKRLGYFGIPTIGFGNSTSTSATGPSGAGFIARCQDSSVAGNAFELFFTHIRVSASQVPFIQVYARKTWNYVPLPGIPTTHPFIILATEDGTGTGENYGNGSSPLAQPLRSTILYPGDTVFAFANAHQAFFHQPTTATTQGRLHSEHGALKIRPLEGENPNSSAVWNIQEAWFHMGGNSGNPQSLFINNFAASGADRSYLRLGGPLQPGGFLEASGGIKRLFVTGWQSSRGSNADLDAVGGFWSGAIAPVMEPWCGFGPIASGGSISTVPSMGQLWDCIVPYRQITGDSPPAIFRWDGQWWRYIQDGKSNPTSPPTSIALRVDSPEIFTGWQRVVCADADQSEFLAFNDGVEGPILEDILTITPVGSAPGTITVTVVMTAAAPIAIPVVVPCGVLTLGYVIPARDILVHFESDSARVTYPSGNILIIPSGSNTGMLDVAVSDIDYAQSITLTVRSANQKQTIIVVSP